MILDFVSGETPAEVAGDLCLIGAGAVGLAIGLEFADTRARVLVIEGGGEHPEPDTQRLYESELRGLRCTTVVSGRARIFGGTTTTWAGQALPLDEGVLQLLEAERLGCGQIDLHPQVPSRSGLTIAMFAHIV